MYCKECGMKNMDIEVKCKNCSTILNTNLPLDGTERVKIIISSLLFLTPILWIAGIITIASFYILKKDKKFTSILNARKYIKVYFLISISIGIIITIFNVIHDINYYESLGSNLVLFYLSFGFGIPILGFILMFTYDNLFFKILNEHKEWIINNGLFLDEKISKKNSIEVASSDNLTSISVADELLKWSDLVEKGLITKEEFQKAKEKILREKLK